jgi:hypothetical protein
MGRTYERTAPLELDPATDEWSPRWVFLVWTEPVSSEQPDE